MDIHLKQSLSESMKSALNNSFDDNFDNLIVSVLNTQECYSCSLQRVEIWKAYKQVLSELKTRKILIIDKKDKDLIALSSLGLGFSIIYDIENDFLTEDGDVIDSRMNTFVVNKDLEIIWLGNPVEDNESFSRFYNILKYSN